MRDRAFGVEIECGYRGLGHARTSGPPECICVYDAELDQYVTEDPDDHCQLCCGCWEDEEGEDGGCRIAANILIDNGFRHWTDDIHGDGSGVEIPSPILRGHEGLMELREVMRLLRDNGFYTGSADGLHVHHDAPEFVENTDLVARLAELWVENQTIIDKFVAPERRSKAEGGYGHWACHPLTVEAVEQFKKSKDVASLAGSQGRFRALNTRALTEHGTIEFRQHEGTLDFNKAAAWIKFGQGLLDSAVRRSTVVTCASALDLLKVAGVSPKTTRTLLMAAAA